MLVYPMNLSSLLRLAVFTLLAPLALAAPLRVLLITGGCCHDYAAQKELLKRGLEARANVVVEHLHTPDKTTRPPLACLNDPDYAKGFDLVIHDECAADIKDPAQVANVLAPHRAGIPAVALHCAMHSYRVASDYAKPQVPGSPGALWFDLLGLQSAAHGPQEPIIVTYADANSPITKGLAGWTTMKEELYNNVQPPATFAGHRSLATGRQTVKTKEGSTKENQSVVVWTNVYGPKQARVFATTLGHNNGTVEDARFLDLVARGVLWATGKLGDDGRPVAGFGPGGR
jgi:type 1 glutamine amidotransferase